MSTNYTLSNHCEAQAAAKGIAVSDIHEALRNVLYSYPSGAGTKGRGKSFECRRHGEDQIKVVGEALNGNRYCLPVSPCCKVVVTVFVDLEVTPLRADQVT